MRRGNINNNEKNIVITENENIITDDKAEVNIISGENKENINEGNINNQGSDKLKIIILIIVIVLAVGVTSGLLIYKYINVKNNVNINENKEQVGDSVHNKDNKQNAEKKETEDKKYLVSFTDMYTENPLTIENKHYEQEATKKQPKMNIDYVEISGLQDKELQERINEEIEENAFYYSDKVKNSEEYFSWTTVFGSFNNILSIRTNITVYDSKDEIVKDEYICLNYDLTTGEQIKFLDLFASNTPINFIIYDIEYERLAWDTEFNFDMSEKEWDNATNMDNRDTSEYEDIILRVINKYKNLDKDKIKFWVSPSLLGLVLPVGENGEEIVYNIKLYKYIDYVTMYKKFSADGVVFENVPQKEYLVFNDLMGFKPIYYKIETENLFISIVDWMDDEYTREEEAEQIKEYSQAAVTMKKKLMNELKDNVLEQVRKLAKTNSKKGYLARFMPYSYIDYYSNDYGGEVLIYVSMDGNIEEMKLDYYKENAFKLLAKQNVAPKVSVDDLIIGSVAYNDANVKQLLYNENQKDIIDISGFYTLEGELVATTYEGVEKYIDSKYIEMMPEIEELPEQQEEVEIDRGNNDYEN